MLESWAVVTDYADGKHMYEGRVTELTMSPHEVSQIRIEVPPPKGAPEIWRLVKRVNIGSDGTAYDLRGIRVMIRFKENSLIAERERLITELGDTNDVVAWVSDFQGVQPKPKSLKRLITGVSVGSGVFTWK